MQVIDARGLTKDYDGVRALDGVSFQVVRGEVFALVGPNGAGKTTLMRMLADILRPDCGSLLLFGSPRVRDSLPRIGYMPEERGLYKSRTPLETVAFFARLKGLGSREASAAAEQALERVGMLGHARRRMEELSKGMSQRVQFAATLAHRPDLLILDEPFSGLDPVSARDLQAILRSEREAGRAVLLSTHNMEHAERLGDRLLMLHRGQAKLYGAIAEIRAHHSEDSLLVEFAGTLPQIPGARAEPLSPTRARLHPADGAARRDILRQLLDAGADVLRFEPVVPSLEDIFIQAAGAEGALALEESRAQEAARHGG